MLIIKHIILYHFIQASNLCFEYSHKNHLKSDKLFELECIEKTHQIIDFTSLIWKNYCLIIFHDFSILSCEIASQDFKRIDIDSS